MATIVVGYDGSKAAGEALRWAAGEAERRGWGVRLLRSTLEPSATAPELEVWADVVAARDRLQADLDATVAALGREHPDVSFSTVLVEDPPQLALAAASDDAAMVVVGARGRGGFTSLLLGSVSHRVAAAGSCTVVVVRGRVHDGGEIVVGVDGSEPSRRALKWAADEARRRGVRLHAVLAWTYLVPVGEHGPEPLRACYTVGDARAALRAIVTEVLGPSPGVELELDPVCEPPGRALVERSADASLLVVGPRSAGRPRFHTGSVTLQLLHHSPCPIAVVRDEDEGLE